MATDRRFIPALEVSVTGQNCEIEPSSEVSSWPHISLGIAAPETRQILSVCAVILIAFVMLLFPRIGYGQTFGQCSFDQASNKCVVTGGTYCHAGDGGAGTCGLGENACWCFPPRYNLSLAPLSPPRVNRGSKATAVVTVALLPGAVGWLGNVQLSCSATGGLTCLLAPATVTQTGQQPGVSQLTVQTSSSTPAGSYTVTVNGPSGVGAPANGPQSATFTVFVPGNGGGITALLTFLGLLSLWVGFKVWRRGWAQSR